MTGTTRSGDADRRRAPSGAARRCSSSPRSASTTTAIRRARWRSSTPRPAPARPPSSCSRCAPRRSSRPIAPAAAPRWRTSTRRRCATSSRATSSTRRRIAPSPRARARTASPGSRARSTRPPSTCSSRLDCDALKIASGDLTHHRLIARAARHRQAARHLDRAVDARRSGRRRDLRPRGAARAASRSCTACRRIRCRTISRTSRAIRTLADASSACRSGSPITPPTPRGVAAAVALGACLYERHVKASETDRGDRRGGLVVAGGARRGWSRRPRDDAARDWARGCATPQAAERPTGRAAAARSTPRATSRAGAVIAEADIIALRPGAACRPSRWRELIGVRTTRALARLRSVPGRGSRRRRRGRRRPHREARLMRLNVLITAASRRVAWSAASSRRCAGLASSGEVIVCDVNPLRRRCTSPIAPSRCRTRTIPDYLDAVRAICVRHQRRPGRADHRRRDAALRGASRDRFDADRHRASRSRRSTPRSRATTSGRPASACAAAGVAGGDDVAAARAARRRRASRSSSSRASGRGGVQAFPARDADELEFFLRYVSDAGRPGVPRRARVHARSALRLRRPAAVGRAARARRHPRRRDRPRPHRRRSRA